MEWPLSPGDHKALDRGNAGCFPVFQRLKLRGEKKRSLAPDGGRKFVKLPAFHLSWSGCYKRSGEGD